MNVWKEILAVVLIASVCYLNYFVLYPLLFKWNKVVYFLALLGAIVVVAFIEMQVVISEVSRYFPQNSDSRTILIRSMYLRVFLRDISFVAFFVILKLYKDAVEAYRLAHEKHRIEVDSLKSKIAPHFLFNNLNKVYNDIEPLSEPIAEKVFAMSQLLKSMIESNDSTSVSLSKEISFIDDLLLLENDSEYINLEVSFECNCKGVEDSLLVPPLIFENFISNAFKFVKKQNGFVRINLVIENNEFLHFSCENNIDKEDDSPVSTGSGIRSTRKRLDLIYPNRYELSAGETTEETFRVDLKIKIIKSV